MSRFSAALLFLALPAIAQSVTIAAGSPTDQYFTGGVGAWPMPLPAPLAFLRYGTSFAYNIPLTNGLYNVSVMLAEPNKTAAGQRIFTVTANGQQTAPIDLYSMGFTPPGTNAYSLPIFTLVGAGLLHLQFAASAGNAVVSAIIITPMTTLTGWFTCAIEPNITSSCAGVEYLSILQIDGTTIYRYAVPAPALPVSPTSGRGWVVRWPQAPALK
jgi:hypothetical protein